MEAESNNRSVTIADIIISSLKAMGDNVGGDSLNPDNILLYREDPQYSDRIENMINVINRGLSRAKRFNAITDFEYIQECITLDDYKKSVYENKIPEELAAVLPLYVKYEMFQADDYRQAFQARDDFDEIVRDIAARSDSAQKSVVNSYKGWLD